MDPQAGPTFVKKERKHKEHPTKGKKHEKDPNAGEEQQTKKHNGVETKKHINKPECYIYRANKQLKTKKVKRSKHKQLKRFAELT